ncbi:uncharacterized protein PgNI_08802 [Pyricularia grisea]|uniref:Uncharacterized protein n=1 Tax=Pyricularia grisea TaxID=148305 RepID=A0A6P8AU70_PYRGI|nr:uncharacterized protein PgNI_08802 [Pyricularia grisea]TLD05757.1 hypothetical protein PgNI_08802 [Pyricularia grisea]
MSKKICDHQPTACGCTAMVEGNVKYCARCAKGECGQSTS